MSLRLGIRNPRTKELVTVHASVTLDRIEALARESMFGMENPGICLACGEERGGCEPDAEWYECECCGARMVFGAEELLIYAVA